LAIHEHPDAVDGILFMSRHINTERSVALFDRARRKLKKGRCAPLKDATDVATVCRQLRIRLK